LPHLWPPVLTLDSLSCFSVAPAAPDSTSLTRLTVLDWVGILLVTASGAFGLAFPLLVAPVFRRMTEQLHATPSALGGVLLGGWLPLLLGALPLGLVGLAVGMPQTLGRRRVLLVLAFALTVLEAAVLLAGMYGLMFTVIDAAGSGS
jgi:hypothetical protein